MATTNWKTATSGDWTTASLWDAGVPTGTSDAVINVANPGSAYTVTIAAGEVATVNSLTLNAPNDGTNQTPYVGAYLQVNGTLAFAAGSPGEIGGSLQSQVFSNSGTFINAGTVASFVQGTGNVLFTGTNALYVENLLQSIGTVTVDQPLAELIGNTLTDGIFDANGDLNLLQLGGASPGTVVNIATIQGPQALPIGWTEITQTGTGALVSEWNGTAYVPVSTTLKEIQSGATLDVQLGNVYTTTNTLTVNNIGTSVGHGLLNIMGGTFTAAGLVLTGAIAQGYGVLSAPVTNNGTLIAVDGSLAVNGAVTGTGVIEFDFDNKFGTVAAAGGTMSLGTVAAGQTIMMNGKDTLVLTSPASFAGTINASNGDKLVLQGVTATSAAVNNGTLTISNGSAVVASLKVAGSLATDSFTTSGSIITVGTAGAAAQFNITDATTNTTSSVAGTAYTGPVQGLQWQFVYPTSDQVTVTAQKPNSFIQVGMQGQKNPAIAGINVSAANGNNVLDSYADSSFLTNGSGVDQNYIDARGSTQNSWSTIVNFHSGSNVTVWGLTSADFTLRWIGDTFGAAGATGLTGVYVPNSGSGPEYAVTLAGYKLADATNGRLAVTYSSINGTNYASIHAT